MLYKRKGIEEETRRDRRKKMRGSKQYVNNPSLPKSLRMSFKVSFDLRAKVKSVLRTPWHQCIQRMEVISLPYPFSKNTAGSYSSYTPYIPAMIVSDFINSSIVFLISLFVWWHAHVTLNTSDELLGLKRVRWVYWAWLEKKYHWLPSS